MLVTGLGWEQGLVLETRHADGEKNKISLVTGQQFAWTVSSQRSCIGHRPPGGDSLLPCAAGVTEISGYQCPECLESAMNLPCLRCVGDYCRNPARRDQCVVPKNHALYLAAFSDQDVKVGVARWTRRHQRIAEQGARAGIIIARDDGQLVRRHEAQIKALGLPDRLSAHRKLIALSRPVNGDLHEVLNDHLNSLRRRMIAPWIEPEIAEIPQQPVLTQPRFINPGGQLISGQIVANWGQLVVSKDGNGEIIAVDGSALIGHQLTVEDRDAPPSYQPALFAPA